MDDFDKDSFRLDPHAKSFQLKGFRWADAPVVLIGLLLAVALLTGLNFVTERVLAFLGRDAALLVCGASVGFLIGVWVGSSRVSEMGPSAESMSLSSLPPLSERVKAIAIDASRKIEAIRAYREESGVPLADAKRMVENHLNRAD